MKVPLCKVSVVQPKLSRTFGRQVCLEQARGFCGIGEDGAEESIVWLVDVGHGRGTLGGWAFVVVTVFSGHQVLAV